MKINLKILFLTFALLALLSCTKGERNIFAFSEGDCDFTLVFPSEIGEIRCLCARRDGIISGKIEAFSEKCPTVTYDGNCYITSGDVKIPLSPEASERFTAIFDTLFRGSEGAVSSRSDDGEFTVIKYGEDTVILNGEGFPVELNVGRKIGILDFTQIKE